MRPHLVIIDGMALLFRSYFASAAMGHFVRLPDGTPSNGAQGFVRHVLTAETIMKPTHLAICWDMGATTFRNEIYDGYKANRPAPPEEMLPQFAMAKQLAARIGWKNYGIAGYEADDLISVMAKKWEDDAHITIISGDKDLLQLLTPTTRIALTQKGYSQYNIYTANRFVEEYGIQPQQFAAVKAFMGDTSDGYPGVKGIGEKTALQLIQKYHSIDGVLASLSQLTPAQQRKIQADEAMLHMSYELAQLTAKAPLTADLSELMVTPYEAATFEQLAQDGYTLIAKHARSLYPFS